MAQGSCRSAGISPYGRVAAPPARLLDRMDDERLSARPSSLALAAASASIEANDRMPGGSVPHGIGFGVRSFPSASSTCARATGRHMRRSSTFSSNGANLPRLHCTFARCKSQHCLDLSILRLGAQAFIGSVAAAAVFVS